MLSSEDLSPFLGDGCCCGRSHTQRIDYTAVHKETIAMDSRAVHKEMTEMDHTKNLKT